MHICHRFKFLRNLSFITLLLLLISIAGNPVAAQDPIPDPQGADFVPGEILVKFKPGFGVQDTQQKLAVVGGQSVQSIPGVDVLRVEVPLGEEQKAIARLQNQADVAYVEPNYRVQALEIPNDPSYGSQWGLSTIDIANAWIITQGSSDITIAVLDTGIDLDHPDFNCTVSNGASKVIAGFNYIADNNNVDDDHGHGTHVAGIAGACTNNSLGVSGVAPNVRLMPIKVLDATGNGNSADVAAGIAYAASHGAKIINLSLGGSVISQVLEDAVRNAYNQNVLVIAAAGNSGSSSVLLPAAMNEAMAVGSTTPTDQRSSFSNYGAALDIVAPGSNIYSTTIGSYTYLSGTSMATPYVSGLAALIWSVEPGLSHDGVRQVIQNTAQDLGATGWDQFYGHGRINAWQALERFAIKLRNSSGLNFTGPITFLDDDSAQPSPSSQLVQVTTANPNIINWQATISPPVPWLTISSPTSGSVSAASPGSFTLIPSQPPGYGVHSATVVVTGTTSSNMQVGPTTIEVRMIYTAKLQRYYLPSVSK